MSPLMNSLRVDKEPDTILPISTKKLLKNDHSTLLLIGYKYNGRY